MIRAACTGEGAKGDHCCYLNGERCPNLVENQGGRRYACGVMLKYGTWEGMAASPEYKLVGEYWTSIDKPFNYCETYDPAFCCRPEYRLGRANQSSPLPVAVALSDPVMV